MKKRDTDKEDVSSGCEGDQNGFGGVRSQVLECGERK